MALADIRTGSNASKKGMEVLNWVLFIVVVVAIATIAMKLMKAFKAGSETAGDIAGGAIIATQTGISIPRQSVCKSAAEDCEHAITRVPLTGWKVWVSDDGLVNALNRLLTPAEAALCSKYFKQISGDSLKEVFEGGYMVEASRSKVSTAIRNALT